MIAAALLLAGAPLPVAAAGADATLGEIRAQLFYESSGTLSGNIAPPAAFSGWNTVIGEGDAKEPAQDLLVTVRMFNARGGGEGFLTKTPLVITAYNAAGKQLATRTAESLLVPIKGGVATALWLRNATCAGRVRVEARYGTQVKRTVLKLDCGE